MLEAQFSLDFSSSAVEYLVIRISITVSTAEIGNPLYPRHAVNRGTRRPEKVAL